MEEMTPLEQYLWLSKQALSGALFCWPVTAAIAAAIALTVWKSLATVTVGRALLLLTPFVAPLLLLLCGTVMEHSDHHREAPMWPCLLVYAVFFGNFLCAAFVVWRTPGHRRLAVAGSALALWLTLWATFVSAMSVSGDWM